MASGAHARIGAAVHGKQLAKSGETGRARAVLEELSDLSDERSVSPYNFALLRRGLDEPDATLGFLDKAFRGKGFQPVI